MEDPTGIDEHSWFLALDEENSANVCLDQFLFLGNRRRIMVIDLDIHIEVDY